MKLFIDLRGQIYFDGDLPKDQQQPVFAFFDTVYDKFESFDGAQHFNSWEDFVYFYTGNELERYKGLCSEWVFSKKKQVSQ